MCFNTHQPNALIPSKITETLVAKKVEWHNFVAIYHDSLLERVCLLYLFAWQIPKPQPPRLPQFHSKFSNVSCHSMFSEGWPLREWSWSIHLAVGNTFIHPSATRPGTAAHLPTSCFRFFFSRWEMHWVFQSENINRWDQVKRFRKFLPGVHWSLRSAFCSTGSRLFVCRKENLLPSRWRT